MGDRLHTTVLKITAGTEEEGGEVAVLMVLWDCLRVIGLFYSTQMLKAQNANLNYNDGL